MAATRSLPHPPLSTSSHFAVVWRRHAAHAGDLEADAAHSLHESGRRVLIGAAAAFGLLEFVVGSPDVVGLGSS
jgi:hypothetical protein